MAPKDERGGPAASTDAGVLSARRSGPAAVDAGRDGRPELTNSPPNSGVVRAQSAASLVRRLSAHEWQAEARACGRHGGQARRGLAASFWQPAAGVERSPRSRRRALPAAYQAPSPRVPPAHASQRACRQLAKRSGLPPPVPLREHDELAAGAEGVQPQRTGSANPPDAALRGRTAPDERGARRHVFPAQIIHEPAAADGRAAARVEDSLRALGSPLPTSRGARTGTPAPPATRWGHLRRGCRLRTGLQRSLVSWTRAGHSGGMRVRRGATSATPALGVRRRGRFPARAFPDPRSAAPRRPGRRARQARISGCETGPDPQPECEHAVGSGRRQ